MKKRSLLLALAVCMAAILSAKAKSHQKPTPDQAKADWEEAMRVTGGDIYKPGSKQGKIVFVNCQKEAPDEWLQFVIKYFTQEDDYEIIISKGVFRLPDPEVQGNLSLFIVDDPALPTILCAPENRWTMVNVAPLKCEKQAFFQTRVKKELSRGFAFLCGGGNSQFRGSLMSVTNLKMLDRHIDHQLPVDVLARFRPMLKSLGVTPSYYDAYINACIHGWAPPPTNEYQKAIWDKVHSIPDKPMKITFDPATQKGKVTK